MWDIQMRPRGMMSMRPQKGGTGPALPKARLCAPQGETRGGSQERRGPEEYTNAECKGIEREAHLLVDGMRVCCV